MRAFIQWLALAPLLVIAGCSTLHQASRHSGLESGLALSPADANLGEALAHYSQALVAEVHGGTAPAAITHFRQAAALDPAHIPVSLRVASDYIGRRDYTGAVSVLTALGRSHPESVDIHLLLGSVLQVCDRPRDAERQFRSAIRLAPDRPDGYIRLATLLVMERESGQALKIVRLGVRQVKDSRPLVEFCDAAGHLLVGMKEFDGAVGFFRQALEFRPDDAPLREALARCYVVADRKRQALEEITRLRALHPGNPLVAVWIGELYELLGQPGPALESYTQAGRTQSLALPVALRKATLEMQLNPEAALITLAESLHEHPDDVRLHVYLALLYMQCEKYPAALIHLESVSRMVEHDQQQARRLLPHFYFWYGSACERVGRFEEGEQYLARYLADDPDAAEVLNYLAYMWADRGIKLEQAGAYIHKALAQEPDNGAFLDTQGWILYRKGDFSNAYKFLKRALRQTGDDPVIYEHLGDVCAALNNFGAARKWWLKSLKLSSKSSSVREKLIKAGVDLRGIGE